MIAVAKNYARLAPGANEDYFGNNLRPNPSPRHLGNQIGERPEFGDSRRRFLVAMTMMGVVTTRHMVERVIAEVETECPLRS